MAYRKKSTTRRRRTHKAKTTRRRRMGAASGSRRDRITKTLLTIVGAAASTYAIKTFGGDGKGKLDPKIIAGITLAAGYFLPTFVKSPMVAGIADGLMVGGGIGLLNEFGVLNGIPIVAGWKELSTVNGTGTGGNGPGAETRRMREASGEGAWQPSTAQMMNGYFRGSYDNY